MGLLNEVRACLDAQKLPREVVDAMCSKIATWGQKRCDEIARLKVRNTELEDQIYRVRLQLTEALRRRSK